MIKLAFDKNNFDIPQESDCISELKELIVKNNLYQCNCGSTNYYWKNDKQVFECKACQKRKSVKAFSDIMLNSNLKINLWVSILHLHCIGCKPREIQQTLNHKKYSTIWEKVFTIEQTEKEYLKTKQNQPKENDTRLHSLSDLAISTQVQFKQAMNSKEHCSCDLYWRWFLNLY